MNKAWEPNDNRDKIIDAYDTLVDNVMSNFVTQIKKKWFFEYLNPDTDRDEWLKDAREWVLDKRNIWVIYYEEMIQKDASSSREYLVRLIDSKLNNTRFPEQKREYNYEHTYPEIYWEHLARRRNKKRYES